jgi:preprotein translocase subunit SecD
MRIACIATALLALLFSAIAHADRPVIEARLVDNGGTAFPTRDGAHLRLGPALLASPLAIASATAAGSEVRLVLAPASAQAFADATAHNVGRQLAILVDGVVQATPTIKDAIKAGKVSVTLKSSDAADKLAKALRTR